MHRAFTLIETIVVVALSSVIIGVLGSLLVYFYKTNAHVLQQSVATAQARRGINDAVHYLREAAYSPDGTAPIQTAATSSVTFFANADNDDELETVRYSLAGGVFTRTVDDDVVTTLSSSIINTSATPIFKYYNTAGTQLVAPIDTADIASVTTTLIIEADTNRGPAAFTLSGRATLRNTRP